MAITVTCDNCDEDAQIGQDSDAWLCPNCGHRNEADEPVEANPPSRAGEISELETRLQQLRAEEGTSGEEAEK